MYLSCHWCSYLLMPLSLNLCMSLQLLLLCLSHSHMCKCLYYKSSKYRNQYQLIIYGIKIGNNGHISYQQYRQYWTDIIWYIVCQISKNLIYAAYIGIGWYFKPCFIHVWNKSSYCVTAFTLSWWDYFMLVLFLVLMFSVIML